MRETLNTLRVDSIPGAWKNLHNGLLALPLFASMLWLIFSLDASSFSVVEIAGVRLRELGGVVLAALMFFVFVTWLHARRLLEEHGLNFRFDGRDDPAFTGIILAAALVFCVAWSLLIRLNESQPQSLPVQRYRFEERQGMGFFQLHLEQEPRQKLALELRGYRPAFFKRMQPGDHFLLVLQPGRLGFPYLSSLAWQPRKGKAVQLWPRQKLKSALAGAVREKEEK